MLGLKLNQVSKRASGGTRWISWLLMAWILVSPKHQQTWQWPCKVNTVYPKKYAHRFCFAVLCCGYTLNDFPISIRLTSLALWQSNDCPSASKATPMNMDEYFMWIHYERLHNHNKAKHNKTMCIFLGVNCRSLSTMRKNSNYLQCQEMTQNTKYVLMFPQINSRHKICSSKKMLNSTHLPLDKIFSDAFSWMKNFVLWLKFHWSLFQSVQSTINQHWFR